MVLPSWVELVLHRWGPGRPGRKGRHPRHGWSAGSED